MNLSILHLRLSWILELQVDIELPVPVLHMLCRAGESRGGSGEAPDQSAQLVHRPDTLLISHSDLPPSLSLNFFFFKLFIYSRTTYLLHFFSSILKFLDVSQLATVAGMTTCNSKFV